MAPGRQTSCRHFTIDDVHPGKSTDAYEAGGDLGDGALGHLEWLLSKHAELRATLFVTPDWREISPTPTRALISSLPFIRDYFYLAPRYPAGTMRLDGHPDFVRYICELPRTDIALHGLHHVHRGPRIAVEFQEQSRARCRSILQEAITIFRSAGISLTYGITPPGFHAPQALIDAAIDLDFAYIASSRDINTPISAEAQAAMTGIRGVPLIFPAWLGNGSIVHIPTNFQATSSMDRARAVIEHGGLLSIKAHIIKNAMGHIALDGLDDSYASYLDLVFSQLRDAFGETLWWTTAGEIASRIRGLNTRVPVTMHSTAGASPDR